MHRLGLDSYIYQHTLWLPVAVVIFISILFYGSNQPIERLYMAHCFSDVGLQYEASTVQLSLTQRPKRTVRLSSKDPIMTLEILLLLMPQNCKNASVIFTSQQLYRSIQYIQVEI